MRVAIYRYSSCHAKGVVERARNDFFSFYPNNFNNFITSKKKKNFLLFYQCVFIGIDRLHGNTGHFDLDGIINKGDPSDI